MIKLKVFDLSISGVVWRFYLMMALTAVFGFFSQWALAAILAFTVAISFIVGVSVHLVKSEQVAVSQKGGRLRAMGKKAITQKAEFE